MRHGRCDFLNGAVEFFRRRRDALHGGRGLCGGTGGERGAGTCIADRLYDAAQILVHHLADAGFFSPEGNLPGDVGRIFHDLEGFSCGVEDRVIGRLNPDVFPAFAHTLKLRRLELALTQRVPEMLIIRACRIFRVDEHAVMLALNFGQAVSDRAEEIVVRPLDNTVEVEMDDGLRFADGVDLPF